MKHTYDVALLLGGENATTRYRSNHAIDLLRQGTVGHIFITGGYGGLVREVPVRTEAEHTREFLLSRDVPAERIFGDGRSLDTLGNFTFPLADPLPSNPTLEEVTFVVVTEAAHLSRALKYCKIILPHRTIEGSVCEGGYNPGLITRVYHASLIRKLRRIPDQCPIRAHKFVKEEHPFYQPGWYDKSVLRRKINLGFKCLQWASGLD